MSDGQIGPAWQGKVIFLDFDGVLNHPGTWQAWLAPRDAAEARAPRVGTEVWVPTERACVERVNEIVAETGARVVISSSWRYVAPHAVLAASLAQAGLIGEVIGETPHHRSPDWPHVIAFLAEKKRPTSRIPRGAEIATWLRLHPGITSYVVLDDVDDMAHVRRRFVQTDGSRGICDADVEQAIRILGKPRSMRRRALR
jgi:hypothetical protein